MSKPLTQQVPGPKLLTSRDKYENSFWMEQLPAHVWVQNEENSVVYSNRLPVNQLAVNNGRYCGARKISCCSAFMGEKNTCPCCPHQRVTSTLQPESCVCRRDEEIYHVFHYPFAGNGGRPGKPAGQVLKIEINVSAFHLRRGKRAVCPVDGRGATPAAGPPAAVPPAAQLVRICSACKKIKNQEAGSWDQLENYFSGAHGIKFSHGLCGDCACRLYPGIWPAKS